LLPLTLFSIFICLFSSYLVAQEKDTNNEYVISYVEHESIINYYVPILDIAYRSIGIKPKFVLINDKRSLMLLNKGEIDADTAKTTETLADHPNIIKVPTPISKIEIMLVCQVGLLCNLSVLDNPKRILGAIGAKEFYHYLLHDSKISTIEVNSFDVLLKLFKQNKVDYIFMVFDDHNQDSSAAFGNKYLIEEKIGYHLVNEKHWAIIPKLDKAIIDAIKADKTRH
jgi:hypothetical protein